MWDKVLFIVRILNISAVLHHFFSCGACCEQNFKQCNNKLNEY
jgi:hypothetical protein